MLSRVLLVNKMKRVLVLGGTGAMGRYLKNELLELGYEVVITTRQNRSGGGMLSYICGNAHDMEFLKRVLKNVKPDAIVDFMSYATEEFCARVDLLLSATSQYIFLSSYRIFNDACPLVETSPRLLDTIKDQDYLKTDEYALSKARCEDILRASSRRNWTIVRPSIIYSKMCFKFGCLEANTVCYRAVRGLPVIMPSEMLAKQTTLTWGGDAAKMIARLIFNRKAYGEDFNIATSEHRTWGEIAGIYSHIIGLKVKEVSLEDYCRICNPKQVMYDRMFTRVMNNTKVLEATGLKQTEFKTPEQGLAEELEDCREEMPMLVPYVGQMAWMDRICGTVCIPKTSLKDCVQYLRIRFSAVNILAFAALCPKCIWMKIRGLVRHSL